ncbi:PP2C family protein-serine/threonine phosphatase [Streptomyces sp. ADI93-02]|uniref:PP2C family protein-serine/threonine phosphatase n=1 Tax=Streptomyces sp. ADI93-02 TaxID=1522757 RepID=UPI001F14C421|nr:PP2C family protein-serine/threonine phosphatase [Streptomyces sp. ADI93-02]
MELAIATIEANELIAHDNTTLQRGLLPAPTLRGDGFEAAARYQPGRSNALLGGDFYDVLQTDDLSVHVILGDVSGHGAAEAALAVHLRMAWRTAVLCGMSQLEQLRILESILTAQRRDSDTYATVVSVVFPPDGHSARVVNAGHPGLLLRRSTEVRWVEPRPGIPLGLFPGAVDWEEMELEIAPGDRVVLFTDGLYEGRIDASARLGEDGLMELAARYSHLPSQKFIDALLAGAASMAAPFGGLADDVAVLHLGWSLLGPPPG